MIVTGNVKRPMNHEARELATPTLPRLMRVDLGDCRAHIDVSHEWRDTIGRTKRERNDVRGLPMAKMALIQLGDDGPSHEGY